ncbi:MAG TPA: ABC transporter permease [Propionibacteriaceae bacterium]|nr:ABC transporter permease [Propionibacteriaceae bacterium]
MGGHNFRTVVAFEFLRTVTKRRFWVLSLSVPLLLALVFALTSASARTTSTSQTATDFSFSYRDASGLVTPAVARAFGGTPTTDAASAIAAVKLGTLTAFIDIPADVGSAPVQVYGQDAGLIANTRYTSLVQALLRASAREKIGDPRLATIASSGVATTSTIYQHGATVNGWGSVILPGLFLLLFYLSIVMLGQQMLNVTLEEKQNRVSEMILTTMSPTTLIVGKVVALIGVGILQAVVFSSPILIARLSAPTLVHIPGVSLSDLTPDPFRMIVGFVVFVFAFAMFAGLLVAIGAVMPTIRDASGAFSAVVVTMMIPLYAIQMIVNQPHALLPTVFTYFPLTAPVTALVRNALGTLAWWEAGAVVIILAVVSTLALRIGVRLFQVGSISYGSRVNIRQALRQAR